MVAYRSPPPKLNRSRASVAPWPLTPDEGSANKGAMAALQLPAGLSAQTDVASGQPLLVRVRRPRIDTDLLTDSRLAAGAAALLDRLSPEVGAMGPRSFVRLPHAWPPRSSARAAIASDAP